MIRFADGSPVPADYLARVTGAINAAIADAAEARAQAHTAEDLRRLADQAERHGIRILVDRASGQHVATSASDPTACYLVSATRGCPCVGFGHWGRCQHVALLLSELGLIPDAPGDAVLDEEPDAPPAIRPLARQYLYDRPHAA